jgi:CRISPR-associated endonuclease Csn1
MRIKHNFGPLTFGFDIGMASVGWAVLNDTQIVDLGVRCFDKAETAKEGESLNLARRTARLMRNRLRQRAWRLTKLARVLKKHNVIADENVLYAARPDLQDTWHLRVAGLDRKLEPDEWARVIYHLCKHRGFYWQSRAEERKAEGDAKGEGGRVKQGLARTKTLLAEKNYRSAAEMVLAEFPDAQRNKRGDYGKALSRVLLGEEFALLFKQQRAFANQTAATELELAILGTGDRKSGLFWLQKPALSGENLLKMLGKCTFEKAEYRAPKASFTAERHVWLTRLTNLRLMIDGRTRTLNETEWRKALTLPYESAEKFTYKHLRSALVKLGVDASFRFTGLAYPSARQIEADKAKDPEGETLVKLPAWHELKSTLKKAGLENEWQQISLEAIEGKPETLDQIAWILSVYKEDDEVIHELGKLDLPNSAKMIDALLDVRFDKFHALSLKALRKILPHMEVQLRYDEACEKAGYHHSQLFKVGKGSHKYLPSLYRGRDKQNRMIFNEDIGDIPRNPVVLRALNQARKVLNALVKAYGSPAAVNIEMARELSKPFDERSKIKKDQDEFRERNEKDKTSFIHEFGIVGAARGGDFEKWKLYREQQGKSAYSLDAIDCNRLLELGYVEIDHALPYSRSFDDSKNNKVLVLKRENQNKGNQTPYEFLDGAGNSERWRNFVGYVESNKAYRMAKRSRLLRKDFGKEESKEFRERNLSDTRYICKFFKSQVEQFLKLHADSEQQRCVVLSGQLTSFLRARWGLIKVRDESDRHHALDAVVIAACTHGMVKRMSDYSRRKELRQVADGFVDMETGEVINPTMQDQLKEHFPDPWPHFRDEVMVRLKIDDTKLMREELTRFGAYAPEVVDQVKPLFVSRAPLRRSGGAAHKETIYAQPERLKKTGGVSEKVALTSLTIKDLDRAIDPRRNEKLYAAIRTRLEAYGGKADKAFTVDNPLRKPDREGKPTGPIVRAITLVIDKLSGVPVRDGIAKNDTMLRVDVFTKAGKFHLVPVYVHHRATGLPNRAVVAFKDEADWTLIDESFAWCFSIYPNDLVRIQQKGKEAIGGYYSSCHRGTGAVNLWAHDRNKSTGKDGLLESIGVKTALSVEKFHVDVLGNIYPAKTENRHGLA